MSIRPGQAKGPYLGPNNSGGGGGGGIGPGQAQPGALFSRTTSHSLGGAGSTYFVAFDTTVKTDTTANIVLTSTDTVTITTTGSYEIGMNVSLRHGKAGDFRLMLYNNGIEVPNIQVRQVEGDDQDKVDTYYFGLTLPAIDLAAGTLQMALHVQSVSGSGTIDQVSNATFGIKQNQGVTGATGATGPAGAPGPTYTGGNGIAVAGTVISLNQTGDITTTANVATISVGAVTDTKGSLANKPASAVVATTNQTLSGTPTIDGQATASGTIILLSAQTAGAENGPWVAAAGAWARPTWYPSGGTTQAFQFITTLIRLGTVYQGSTWRMTTSGAITIDTTATTWVVTPHTLNSSTITATTSAALAAIISDETGTGPLVFANTPTLTTAILGSSTATTQAPADNSTKVATTAYVDNAALGQNFKEAAIYGSTAALPAVTYANGASGVGATLTEVGLGALSLDGNAPTVGQRVLIKNQVAGLQNGIYVVTVAGDGITAFVLTRSADFNQSSDILAGDSLLVTSGTTLSTTTWAYNGIDSPTMGTTALTFVQTAGTGSFTAGNGITITGNSIAINTAVTADLTTAQALSNKTLTTPIINGLPTGTGVASAATASTLTARDANANELANNFIGGYATTATAAGTTTLTVASAQQQFFTGATTQTVTLPVTSTLVLGFQFFIKNNSSGAVTVNSSGGNAVQVMAANSLLRVTCILTSGTTAASWSASYMPDSAGAGTVTSVSVTTANGVSGSVATATTTPAITLTLGNITPGNVNMTGVLSGSTPQTVASANVTGGTGPTAVVTSQWIVTGTTNFSRIDTVGLQDRTMLYIKFTGALTIAQASAISGTLYGIRLPGSTGYTTSANDTLQLMLDLGGGFWYTVSRTLA